MLFKVVNRQICRNLGKGLASIQFALERRLERLFKMPEGVSGG